MLRPVDIQPGIVRAGTQYKTGAAGHWWDGNLVRWRSGALAPVGGWARRSQSAAAPGFVRDLYAWRDNASQRYLAVGSNEGLYISAGSDTLADVTPASFAAGRENAIRGYGFGYGPFGAGPFGTARPDASGNLLPVASWSFDNWGENLIAMAPHDGRILEWTLDPQTPAAAIANAPFDNRAILVTPERHLMALGAGGDARRIEWSSREDSTLWTAAATNTAGGINLETKGEIQTGVKVRGQTLVLTSQDVHVVNYVRSPLVYGTERVSSSGGTRSPRSAVAHDGGAVWMAEDGFYMFDGAVRKMSCDVEDFVFGHLNEDQINKVVGGRNRDFNEMWWVYPSGDSLEPDRYVAWDYRGNHWMIGALERTAYQESGVFPNPIMAAADGYLYDHEFGWTADGAPLTTERYVESGAVDLGQGDRMLMATKLIPDERTQGQTQVRFQTRPAPNGPETEHGPYTMTDRTDVRFVGRQVALRIEGLVDDDWRVGTPRLELQEKGKR